VRNAAGRQGIHRHAARSGTRDKANPLQFLACLV
jgi:hypothetical protein